MASSLTDTLQDHIAYRFQKPEWLLEALTHSSYARETSGPVRDNEQLEFLGDAVLGFVVSFRLADAFPGHPEGKLSRARSRLVAAENLSKAAARLDLGRYLRLGRGEEKTGGRFKSRLAVNALEALVAAIYLDGGLHAAEEFISAFILPSDLKDAKHDLFTIDYKSSLQERLQAEGRGAVCYEVIEEAGPQHRKTFLVEARALGISARGSGESKKLAEQEAAKNLLDALVEKT
ncbi:MAG: ribonuclease III [Terriglobia bacterium]